MSDAAKTYPVPAEFAAKANLSPETYREMYAASISDPEAFWGSTASGSTGSNPTRS